jgi:hypothetical protein
MIGGRVTAHHAVVEVLSTGVQPLIGTLLLDGHELHVEFREGGVVSITVL